jgi:outer membrane protein OmpA-like peptidoglycan-associated protein
VHQRRLYVPLLLLISSCSSPPSPPAADERLKRPANNAAAIDLQVCRSELHNTRIVAAETTRLAESASATATRLTLLQQRSPAPSSCADMRNLVVSVPFAFGSSEVRIPQPASAHLADQARTAALVVLRGRTDGSVELPAESRIARERTAAVRAWLVHAGVDPARIRSTWQPVGDHFTENGTPAGRARNRRVEIELYRSPPQTFAVDSLPQV